MLGKIIGETLEYPIPPGLMLRLNVYAGEVGNLAGRCDFATGLRSRELDNHTHDRRRFTTELTVNGRRHNFVLNILEMRLNHVSDFFAVIHDPDDFNTAFARIKRVIHHARVWPAFPTHPSGRRRPVRENCFDRMAEFSDALDGGKGWFHRFSLCA